MAVRFCISYNTKPKRPRYLRSLSASFEKVLRDREAPNNVRPASDKRATTPAHIHDEAPVGRDLKEVQLFQLPIIKEFLKIGW